MNQERDGEHASTIIEISDLSYTYPGDVVALDRVCLQVGQGEHLGLVGPNGAGKTTLFLCLSGVLPIKKNMAKLAGMDPGDSTQRKKLPTKVGIVFQNSDDQLFNSTVFDEVAFGPLNLHCKPEEVRQRVTDALERVDMADCEERVPFHLSGGEKRRVALASVLAMRPEILLLDEPSQFLDPRGRRELIELLHRLEGTKIIASHDLELILELCPRVALLEKGRVEASGPTAELFANRALMEAHGLEVPYSLRG